jgi:hypothetical protein
MILKLPNASHQNVGICEFICDTLSKRFKLADRIPFLSNLLILDYMPKNKFSLEILRRQSLSIIFFKAKLDHL